MHTFDLSMEHITKVEGNAALRLKVENGKVIEVKFAIEEYKRFFTDALKGKPVAAVASHLSRICGTCSSAHIMCSIAACEDALGIVPSEQTKILRVLATHGNIIRDHALHLYLFCMPDIFGVDAFLDLDESDSIQHQILHDGFDIKSAGNYLATLIAGRSVHANYPVVGGFLHFPEGAGIEEAIEKLKNIRPAVLRLIKIFMDAPFHFDRKTKYMALVPDKSFGYLNEGKIITSKGESFEEKDYRSHLEHVVIPYSQASGYTYQGEGFMVGALARLNLAKEKLHSETKKSAKEALELFPSTDIFHNNLAQAIEILHSIDESVELLSNNEFKPERPRGEASKKIGIGVVEAPRGTLYHKIVIGADGIVESGEVIVPTGQNQINIERDIGILVEDLIKRPEYAISHIGSNLADNSKEIKEKIAMEIEKLIRAYDPCMSCATHFLKVEWL
ncbi:MAG: nickel-dependent hydrogenase large subunit [Candidatus Paceibacterota bacterium]|jgi:coenzyme F420-reducing hydrogenase alpha subunit